MQTSFNMFGLLSTDIIIYIFNFCKFAICDADQYDAHSPIKNSCNFDNKCELQILYYLAAKRKDLRYYLYVRCVEVQHCAPKMCLYHDYFDYNICLSSENIKILFDYIAHDPYLVIAGGFPTQLYIYPNECPRSTSDIDIYVLNNKDAFLQLLDKLRYMGVEYLEHYTGNITFSIYECYVSDIPYKIQIICIIYTNPYEVVNNFDYSHNKCFIYGGHTYLTPDSFISHKEKITYNAYKLWPLCRVQKTIKYGFKIYSFDEEKYAHLLTADCCCAPKKYITTINLVITYLDCKKHKFDILFGLYSFSKRHLYLNMRGHTKLINISDQHLAQIYNAKTYIYKGFWKRPVEFYFDLKYFDPLTVFSDFTIVKNSFYTNDVNYSTVKYHCECLFGRFDLKNIVSADYKKCKYANDLCTENGCNQSVYVYRTMYRNHRCHKCNAIKSIEKLKKCNKYFTYVKCASDLNKMVHEKVYAIKVQMDMRGIYFDLVKPIETMYI